MGFTSGKRKQYWFHTEKEAKQAAADRNSEITAYGTQVTLSAAERMRAFNAAERLSSHGKTLDDATEFYLNHLNKSPISLSTLTKQVRAEFKRRLENNEASTRHRESMENALRKLETHFGNRPIAEISTSEIRAWLLGLPIAAKTRNKIRGYARQIFGIAVDHGLNSSNPVSPIKKFRERHSEEKISILSVEETRKLLHSANPLILPFLTLSFFAGIRRATLERLDWSEVHFNEKLLIVPRYKGKNQKRYQVTLAENALAWLRPYLRESGSLLPPSRAPQSYGKPSKRRARKLILDAAQAAEIALPDNTGRHTYISMHVAFYESIDKTAKEADTSPEIIKTDYLGMVTRKEAERYWQILP